MRRVRITDFHGILDVSDDEIEWVMEEKEELVRKKAEMQNRKPKNVAASLAAMSRLKQMEGMETKSIGTSVLEEETRRNLKHD